MGIRPHLEAFSVDGDRVNKVAGMLSIRATEVRDGLKIYIAFRQLQQRIDGVEDKHFSLVQSLIGNRHLNAHGVVEKNADTYVLGEQTVQTIEQLCQFSTRDSLTADQRILPRPQSVALLGRLKDKAETADSEAVRALARRVYAEATSGEIDQETGKLRLSVESALNSVLDLESRTKWLEALDSLTDQMEKELTKADFRSYGNDLLHLDKAKKALLPLRRVLGIGD
jgi:hypothetical protein